MHRRKSRYYEMLGEVAPRRRARRDGNVERREEVPTVYLDCASSSVSSLGCQEDHAGPEVSMSMPYLQHSREAARDDDGSISSGNYSMHAPSPPPLLSSSSDSVAMPISSGNPSFSHLPLEEHEQHQEKEEWDQLSQPRIHEKDHQRHQGSGPEIIEVAHLELRLPPPQMQTQTGKRRRRMDTWSKTSNPASQVQLWLGYRFSYPYPYPCLSVTCTRVDH